VLIPRPETELLVEVALELRPSTVLDVGTGSGAIALALVDEMPGVSVAGVDTSAAAIEVARANADRLGSEGVNFAVGASSLRYAGISRPDLILANLPYVRDDEWASLAPEIRDYEPKEALLGGADGLGPIRDLLAACPDCPAIALEVGEGQAPEVERLVQAAGFRNTERRRDLTGIERVVLGRRT
jgi:release factor glutamine methyltransferase